MASKHRTEHISAAIQKQTKSGKELAKLLARIKRLKDEGELERAEGLSKRFTIKGIRRLENKRTLLIKSGLPTTSIDAEIAKKRREL